MKNEILLDLKEANILELINSLENLGNLIFCGGYIRNKYLKIKDKPRDIDLIIRNKNKNTNLYNYILNYNKEFKEYLSTNRYGGIKIKKK